MEDCGHRPRRHAGFTRSGRFARQMMVVVASAFALSLAVPALAGAHVTWATNYIPVSKSTAMEWTGKLKFSNSYVESSLECADAAQGSVGANGVGEITKMTMSSCKNVRNCGAPLTITALNLPWHTELVSEGLVMKNVLSNGGKGNPGFRIECTIVFKLVEECTASSTLSTTATNSELGVTAAFNNGEKLTCSHGGTATGSVEGSQSMTAASGTLSVHKEEPVWLKKGVPLEGAARSINWANKNITLYSTHGFGVLGVSCEDSGEGAVEVGGVGSITKFTITKCKKALFESECTSGYSLTATHLPWKTELYFGFENVVGDSFVDSGAGAPNITLKCVAGPTGEFTDECKGVHIEKATNSEHAVLAQLNEGGLSCSGALGGRFYESPQTIELGNGEALNVS